MNFGQRLLDILDEKNMTRADLCRLTGLKSANMVSYIKDPNRSPRLSTAVKIADALDVSLDYLAGRTGPAAMAFEDAETQRVADGFTRLNRDGRVVVMETVSFQLQKNQKIAPPLQADKVPEVA